MGDFPDVSSYQGTPNWQAVKNAGFVGAMIKAYEYHTDPSFGYNWSTTGQVGLQRGAYCFGRPTFAPSQQANAFADVVLGAGYQPGDWPLVLDAEVDGISPDWCIGFLQTLDARTGKRSILYTYSAFLSGNLGSDGRLAAWPLWIANYGSSVTTPWPYWAWQYTDNGFVPGIGNCDVSHLVGSIPTPGKEHSPNMAIKDNSSGLYWLIGTGAAHVIRDVPSLDRLKFVGVPDAGTQDPLHVIQFMQDFGAWDYTNNKPKAV